MQSLLKSTSLVQRAYWLIRLRWVAIAALAAATLGASEFMGVSLPVERLYTIAVVVFLYNLGLYELLRYWTQGGREPSDARIGSILAMQISMDLFILTAILHFSGGIENPFFLFFAFHMIIASILRSRLESYLQATLAVMLFGGWSCWKRWRGCRIILSKGSPDMGSTRTAGMSWALCLCSVSRCISSCT